MKSFKDYLDQTGEFGEITEIRHPVVTGLGLPNARVQELLIFENGEPGQIFSVEDGAFSALVFSQVPLRVGERVARTNEFLSIPVGEEYLGKVIDPLGKIIAGSNPKPREKKELDQPAKGIIFRSRARQPFLTGVGVVDLLIPLGKGQRELVIGDRKTGKTSFLLSTVKNQAKEGAMVIYALIGKKKSDIKRLEEYMVKEKLAEKMVMVASEADDSPCLIYLTPYAAMTLAEYFRDQGREVVVVMDDLSTHARFYREISLLGKSFPGRDSYPGDIFYIHAKLLERAGNFKQKKGEASITCLPVVETVEGDLTGYIPTNLMGMTDGHIFFDSNVYAKGRRPAINIALSVTRVGRQTQTRLKREINQEITAFLARYDKVQDYTHFGAELSAEIKEMLEKGERFYDFFDQHYHQIIPEEVQIVLFALIWTDTLKNLNQDFEKVREKLIVAYGRGKDRKIIKEITRAETIAQLQENVLKKAKEIIKMTK